MFCIIFRHLSFPDTSFQQITSLEDTIYFTIFLHNSSVTFPYKQSTKTFVQFQSPKRLYQGEKEQCPKQQLDNIKQHNKQIVTGRGGTTKNLLRETA